MLIKNSAPNILQQLIANVKITIVVNTEAKPDENYQYLIFETYTRGYYTAKISGILPNKNRDTKLFTVSICH